MASLTPLLLVFLVLATCKGERPDYCEPEDKNCWPTQDDINSFSQSLKGQLLTKDNPDYFTHMNGFNTRTIQYPAWIIVLSNAEDIQKGVKFAINHHLQISMYSTGHSFSGRNTWNNSLMLNFQNMKGYQFNGDPIDPTSITVETG